MLWIYTKNLGLHGYVETESNNKEIKEKSTTLLKIIFEIQTEYEKNDYLIPKLFDTNKSECKINIHELSIRFWIMDTLSSIRRKVSIKVPYDIKLDKNIINDIETLKILDFYIDYFHQKLK